MPQLMRQLLKVTLEQWREMKVHGEVHTHVVKPGVTQVCCCIGLRCIIGPLKSPEDEENYTFIFSLAKLGLVFWLLTKAFVYISFCSISCYFFKAKAIPFINRKIPAVKNTLSRSFSSAKFTARSRRCRSFEHLVGVEKRVRWGNRISVAQECS